mgnify:CR=1 FL=1
MLLKITIIINILLIPMLLICMAYFRKKNGQRKIRENLGFTFGITMIIYLALLVGAVICGIFERRFEEVALVLFVVAPFVIGHFSSYEKMYKYSFIQLLFFILSLLFMLCILK